jgi:hypothetical protein
MPTVAPAGSRDERSTVETLDPVRSTTPVIEGTQAVTQTPAALVVRQSTRPTSERPATPRTAGDGGEDGLPAGLIWFGAVAGGIALVGAGIAVRRNILGS